jgi:phosphatidylethanolamine/phosphatidyl-N-methylethanolamine N-methyltransferase
MKKKFDFSYGSQSIWYSQYYNLINVRGSGVGAKTFRKIHEYMERPYKNHFYSQILEIGGGTGEHLEFIRHGFDKYWVTDIRQPNLPAEWSLNEKIIPLIANAENLPFPDASFDRIIATCLLHHVDYPERVLEEIKRLIRPGGVATIYLTCDPGLALRFIRRITMQQKANKLGFHGFKLLMAREHRNHVGGLLEMIKFVFRDASLKIKYLPLGIPSWNLNGSIVVHISK